MRIRLWISLLLLPAPLAAQRYTFQEYGLEALAALYRDPGGVDLVLMDVQMPELDGLQATAAL